MEAQARERISVILEEAIDFVNEVQVRFQDRRQDYKLFLDVLIRFAWDRNLLHRTVACIFRDHPDLLRNFERFLFDSKPLPLSQTVPIKHQDAIKALEFQAEDFIRKVNRRLRHLDFYVFMDELHQCWIKEFDENKTKSVAEKYIGEFSDLMEEFEDFYNRCAQVRPSVSTEKREHEQSLSANEPCLCETPGSTCSRTEPSPPDSTCSGSEPSPLFVPSKRSKPDAPPLNDHECPEKELLNDNRVCEPSNVTGEINPPNHNQSK